MTGSRPRQERSLAGQDRPGRRPHRPGERQDGVQLERPSGRSTRFGAKTGLEWGVAPLPNIGGTKAAWAGSHQFVLPTQRTPDENKAVAPRVFLNWISTKSIEWAKGGQVPGANSVRESEEFKALKDQATLATQIDDLHFPPTVAGIRDAMPEFYKALNSPSTVARNPAKALSDTAARANEDPRGQQQEVRRRTTWLS